MRIARALAVAILALTTTACTTVIQPMRVTTWHHPPAPVYVVPAHPEVYYFGYQAPVVVYRRHREYVPFYGPQWHRPYRW